jgi:hypothetical protein
MKGIGKPMNTNRINKLSHAERMAIIQRNNERLQNELLQCEIKRLRDAGVIVKTV